MNILACVKQVPDTTEIKIDPVKHTLIRKGVPSIVNTFDAYGLELGARLKESLDEDSTITILTMGPPQAEVAIKECLAKGGDRGYLLTDRAFGGSDTLATSYILSQAVEKLEKELGTFDLIICGKQAIDGDTAQVGPELAEHLGIPMISYATDFEYTDGELIVKRESDKGYDRIGVKLPALITVDKTDFEPRFPTIKAKLAANRAKIEHITAADMADVDLDKCGLSGSPTKVKKTFTPVHENAGVKIAEETGAESAVKLVAMMAEAKLV